MSKKNSFEEWREQIGYKPKKIPKIFGLNEFEVIKLKRMAEERGASQGQIIRDLIRNAKEVK